MIVPMVSHCGHMSNVDTTLTAFHVSIWTECDVLTGQKNPPGVQHALACLNIVCQWISPSGEFCATDNMSQRGFQGPCIAEQVVWHWQARGWSPICRESRMRSQELNLPSSGEGNPPGALYCSDNYFPKVVHLVFDCQRKRAVQPLYCIMTILFTSY